MVNYLFRYSHLFNESIPLHLILESVLIFLEFGPHATFTTIVIKGWEPVIGSNAHSWSACGEGWYYSLTAIFFIFRAGVPTSRLISSLAESTTSEKKINTSGKQNECCKASKVEWSFCKSCGNLMLGPILVIPRVQSLHEMFSGKKVPKIAVKYLSYNTLTIIPQLSYAVSIVKVGPRV